VRCDNCGAEALALKTCRFRAGEIRFVLCDTCWLSLWDGVWIVPGQVPCFGTCRTCGDWISLNELRDQKPGGARKGDAPGGLCERCVSCAG